MLRGMRATILLCACALVAIGASSAARPPVRTTNANERALMTVNYKCFDPTHGADTLCVGPRVLAGGQFWPYGTNYTNILQGQGLMTYDTNEGIMRLLICDGNDQDKTKVMKLDVLAGSQVGKSIDVSEYITSIVLVGVGQYIEKDLGNRKTYISGFNVKDIQNRHIPIRHSFFEIHHKTDEVKDMGFSAESLLGEHTKHNLLNVLGGKISAFDEDKKVFWQLMARNNTDKVPSGQSEFFMWGANMEKKSLENFYTFPRGDCIMVSGGMTWDDKKKKIIFPLHNSAKEMGVGEFDPYTGDCKQRAKVDSPSPFGNVGSINAYDPDKRTFAGFVLATPPPSESEEPEYEIYRDEELDVAFVSHPHLHANPTPMPGPSGEAGAAWLAELASMEARQLNQQGEMFNAYEYSIDTGNVDEITWSANIGVKDLPMQIAYMWNR